MKKEDPSNNIKIAIIGVGMVGGNLRRYFEEERGYKRRKDLFLYDIDRQKKCSDDVNKAHVVFVCVPTPRRRKDGVCDTRALDIAIGMLEQGKVVVIKSTVSPGTTEQCQKKYPHHVFLFNPEFLTESRAWEDTVRPDRQVVGHTVKTHGHASVILGLLPQAFFSSPGTLGTYNFIRINATEAEIGKYAGNTFGAMKVTFGNILADLCKHIEINMQKKGVSVSVQYEHVRAMLAHDRRINDAWLDVGHGTYRGFGGYCFPKDVSALIAVSKDLLRKAPRKSKQRATLAAAVRFLEAMWDYNEALLASQGLSVKDVSVHDKEWIQRKIKRSKKQRK